MATTIPETLSIAVKHHQAGRLRQAEQLYRRILQADPNHVDTLHLLGVVASHHGDHKSAIDYIGRAIAMNPQKAAFHVNLGVAYVAVRSFEKAVASYERALQLKPGYAEVYYNLGIALKEQGKPHEAAASYLRAVQIRPDYAEAHNNLGNALKAQGKLDEAVANRPPMSWKHSLPPTRLSRPLVLACWCTTPSSLLPSRSSPFWPRTFRTSSC